MHHCRLLPTTLSTRHYCSTGRLLHPTKVVPMNDAAVHSGEGHGEGDRHLNKLCRGGDRAPPSKAHGKQKLNPTENAVYLIVEAICATWRPNTYCVVSLLMLDVKGAFDNFSHKRLLHNLRKRRIQPRAISYIQSFLGERSTIIRILEGDSPSSGRTGVEKYQLKKGSPLNCINLSTV